MKVLLDTNIVLDAVASREPFRETAEEIFMLVAEEQIDGFITANSITDIYFIARKSLTDAFVRDSLGYLFMVFSIIDVRGVDCEQALDFPMNDYEDALLSVCGGNADIDYIITRDVDFLGYADILPVISPDDFLDLYHSDLELQ
jgi:predicted nucleic acid-binding protein